MLPRAVEEGRYPCSPTPLRMKGRSTQPPSRPIDGCQVVVSVAALVVLGAPAELIGECDAPNGAMGSPSRNDLPTPSGFRVGHPVHVDRGRGGPPFGSESNPPLRHDKPLDLWSRMGREDKAVEMGCCKPRRSQIEETATYLLLISVFRLTSSSCSPPCP